MVRPRTKPSAKVPDNPATDAPLPPTGSSSNGLNVMEEKIKGIEDKVKGIEDKIEGIKLKMVEMDKKLNKLVNHMKMKEDVADQQARLGSELCKIRDLRDSDICLAIKALSTGHDSLRIFYGLPPHLKKSYIQSLSPKVVNLKQLIGGHY